MFYLLRRNNNCDIIGLHSHVIVVECCYHVQGEVPPFTSKCSTVFFQASDTNFSKCFLEQGAIQVLRNQCRGWEGVRFPLKKRYEDVGFNVISVTKGVGGCQISRKKSVT